VLKFLLDRYLDHWKSRLEELNNCFDDDDEEEFRHVCKLVDIVASSLDCYEHSTVPSIGKSVGDVEDDLILEDASGRQHVANDWIGRRVLVFHGSTRDVKHCESVIPVHFCKSLERWVCVVLRGNGQFGRVSASSILGGACDAGSIYRCE
jgi:hypothetical protein